MILSPEMATELPKLIVGDLSWKLSESLLIPRNAATHEYVGGTSGT